MSYFLVICSCDTTRHLLHKSQICLVSSYYIYALDPLLCLCCIVNGVMYVSAKFSISVLIAVTTNTQYENWINKVNELKDEIYRVRLHAFVLIYSKELEWNGQVHCQAFLCARWYLPVNHTVIFFIVRKRIINYPFCSCKCSTSFLFWDFILVICRQVACAWHEGCVKWGWTPLVSKIIVNINLSITSSRQPFRTNQSLPLSWVTTRLIFQFFEIRYFTHYG